MERKFTKFFLMFVLGIMGLANAQRVVTISPTEFGIINDVINGDTLANGDRVDINTIYELERGPNAYYIFNGTIANGYPLHIRAAAGDGERPKLVPGVLEGGISSRLFQPSADLTLEGLYLTGQDNSNVMYDAQTIWLAAEGIRLTIDDCHFHGDRQCFIRTGSANTRVFITNSLMGYSILNGRAIDLRGNILDSLLIQNSTFYNIVSRPVRDGGDGYTNYMKIDHVTYVNIGEEPSQLGETVDVSFTNNLIVNPGFFGVIDDGSPDAYFNSLQPLTTPYLVDTLGAVQTVNIRNNNLWIDPRLVDMFATLNLNPDVYGDTTVVVQRILANEDAAPLIPEGAFISEPIEFSHGPNTQALVDLIREVWEVYDGDEEQAQNLDNGPEGVDVFGDPLYGTFQFDLSYPTTTASYTAADDGFPLGDLNWFPDKYSEWQSITDVEDEVYSPGTFSLEQNYPNPFNPSTKISFTLPAAGTATLTIYNIIGETISTLVSKDLTAGNHSIDFNASSLSSGVYFYKLEAGNYVAVKKMMMMK